MDKEDILILGAGPAGMAASFELYKAGKSFIVIERNKSVGGLARTLQFGKFRTDTGPHRFYSKNPYLYYLIKELLGDDWILVNRFTRFYINGKFYKYPIELRNALSNIGLYKTFRAISDYLIEKIKKTIRRNKPKTFERHIISNFGRTLAEINILNYTEKIWGIPCSEISVEWAKQRIKGLSMGSAIKKIVFKKSGPKTMVDQFYYPRRGTGMVYEAMEKEIAPKKGKILKNSYPTKILHDGKKVKEIHINNNGKNCVLRPKKIISTIPITDFINLLHPPAPKKILNALKKLRYRSQVYLFLIVNKPRVAKDNWIYFPDKEIPFGRISEMKNFSADMSPKDKTSLFIEFFCWENDSIWKMNKEKLFKITIEWLEKINLLNRNEVIDYFLLKQKNVYPVYDLKYKLHLNKVKKWLDGFQNLLYIGRQARFRYNNQDHSIEMGILAARSIIENKKYDFDKVGAEEEYFEKGKIPEFYDVSYQYKLIEDRGY